MAAHAQKVASEVAAVSEDLLLEIIVAKWERHTVVMSMIRDILMYLVCDFGELVFDFVLLFHQVSHVQLKFVPSNISRSTQLALVCFPDT